MKTVIAALCMLVSATAAAAEGGKSHSAEGGRSHSAEGRDSYAADVAVKTSRIETLRARAAGAPSATTSTTLIEADNLLRQYRTAPADKRDALRAQIEVALTRLELEIDAAARGK